MTDTTRYRVAFDGSFDIENYSTQPPSDAPSSKACKKALLKANKKLQSLQRLLYAHNYHSVLLVFQAMDAAGKDSTIRAVMSGVNPAGCEVSSFKRPSDEELDHDFLWRSAKRLPERGRIGIFNRSYYEEVLAVRVHPHYLRNQRMPFPDDLDNFFEKRFESINDHEKHLARNGTLILKFFLNVSKDEQKNRFLARLDTPEKNWKFSAGDLKERALWEKYMQAYQSALNATSSEYAPWFCIPADEKPYMRLQVANIIVAELSKLDMHYPDVCEEDLEIFAACRHQLLAEP